MSALDLSTSISRLYFICACDSLRSSARIVTPACGALVAVFVYYYN